MLKEEDKIEIDKCLKESTSIFFLENLLTYIGIDIANTVVCDEGESKEEKIKFFEDLRGKIENRIMELKSMTMINK